MEEENRRGTFNVDIKLEIGFENFNILDIASRTHSQ